MDNLDIGILSVVDRVMYNYAKTIKHKYVEFDELRNEVFIKLKQEFLSKPLINNSLNDLYHRGMTIAAGYTASVRRQSHIQDRISDSGRRMSLFDLIKSRENRLPDNRLLDKETKLLLWGSTKQDRVFRSIDSRIFAYLLFVEEWSMQEIADYFGYSKNRINTSIYHVTVKPEKYKMTIKKDDVVILNMDNPFFDRMLGRVKEVTDYGAVVLVESHSYPQRKQWELRCTNEEMVYIGTLAGKELINKISSESVTGSHKKPAHVADMGKYEVTYNGTPVTIHVPSNLAESKREYKSSGDLCSRCGGMLVRTGSCQTCNMCGDNSGCG